MPYANKEDRDANQAKYRKANFDRLWSLLLNSECKDCGNSNPMVLEFDHLPGSVKKFDVARAVAGSTRSWLAIQAEIDKCDVVCANCHRIRTARRGGFLRYKASLLP